MQEIIVTSRTRSRYDVSLEDRALTLRTLYSNVMDQWTFDLVDRATGDPVLSGVPIVTGLDLLEPYGLGLGALVAAAIESPGRDPRRDELGQRVKLIHVPVAEVEEIQA